MEIAEVIETPAEEVIQPVVEPVTDRYAGITVVEGDPPETDDEEVIDLEEIPEEVQPLPEKKDDEPTGQWKKSIDRLTRQKYELVRKVEELGTKLQSVSGVSSDMPIAPSEDDFDNLSDYHKAQGEYVHALTTWRVDTALAKRDQDAIRTEIDSATKGIQSEEAERNNAVNNILMTDGVKKYPDLLDKIKANPLHPIVADLVYESDNPIDVAHFLVTNKDIADSLSQMTPTRAAYTIGQLELKLKAPPKTVTKAPPVTTPIGGPSQSNVVPFAKKVDQMSQADYEKWRKSGGGR